MELYGEAENMVTIVTGGSNSSREDIFVERIRQSVLNGEDVLVIIPDQFSFEYEKKLYFVLGARLFNSIRTAGFNRLAEIIAESSGGYSRDSAGDNAKIILMYRAVRRLVSEGGLRFYKKSADKGGFITELIELIGQLRESGVTPDGLQLAAERLEGSVSLKLLDIAKIYRSYIEELDRANMKDSLSAMSESVRLAEKNNFFKGVSLFVSSFNSFTYDEKKMLELAVRQGAGLTVSLLLDSRCVRDHHSHPFAVTVKTQQFLTDLAKLYSKNPCVIDGSESSFHSKDIASLGTSLFNFRRSTDVEPDGSVKIFSADDMYEEAEFICAEICRLVREEDCTFGDIAVTVRSLEEFAPVIEGMMERYDIPYFTDRRDSIAASAIVHYINAVFKTALTKKFRTDNIMRLIKSPLFGILNYDVTDLEDYCIKWGVDGDMWLSPFTAGGSGDKLEKINILRSQIIDPLESFKKSCRDASAKEICEAFYRLLGDIRLSEQTYSVVRRAAAADNETQTELARGLKQLWSMSLSAVKAIYECLGDEKISLRQYYELYRIMLSQMKASNPPQKLDCVRITDASRSRTDGVRVMFAAEVNDGIFPAQVKQGGLVTQHEKELLRLKENIVIDANSLNDFQNERLTAYCALTAPTDKLYLTYTRSDLLGNEKRPSMLVKEVMQILGIRPKNINSFPAEFFCTSYKTAYSKYTQRSKDRTSEMQSIYESIIGSGAYYGKLVNLRKTNARAVYGVSGETAGKLFFHEGVTEVSPTKLDVYYHCPFKYFCSYGLKLKKAEKVEINGLNTGNIIHGLLESILREPDAPEGEGMFSERFLTMSDIELTEYIDEYFERYYRQEFCGDFGKKPSFAYRYARLKERALSVVKYVRRELAGTSFRPVLLEHKISRNENGSSLEISLSDGRKIVLIGTIDRADIYTGENGEKYVRIIDYKTGNIDFKLSGLYNGLNLQMLVYLSTLLETENEINCGSLKQAGVFYLSFRQRISPDEDSEADDAELYEAACEKRINSFKRLGKAADIPEVDKAMGAARGRDEKMNDGMFTAMREFAKLKVREYGDSLLNGKIAAKPLEGSCAYCDFQNICGQAFPDGAVNPSDPSYGRLMEEKLREIAEQTSLKGDDE